MLFTPIEYESWERREYYECYGKTTINMTVNLDISQLYQNSKSSNLRLYPLLIYAAAKVINEYPEFSYAYGEDHQIGMWDCVHPFYTVPRSDNPELFSVTYTEYTKNFQTFYENFLTDYREAQNCGKLNCHAKLPPNICGISIAPSIHYTSFNFGGDAKEDLTPFTLFGKFVRDHEKILIPVSGEFAHAVNDGVHVSRFFAALEQTANNLI